MNTLIALLALMGLAAGHAARASAQTEKPTTTSRNSDFASKKQSQKSS